MKSLIILNEELYAKNLLLGKNKDIKSAIKKIGYITRYYFHVLKKSDDENYIDTVRWMSVHQENFDENSYSNVIVNAIKEAKKRPFYKIDNIKIKRSELEIIRSLDNLREEKILFVLLCMAKHQFEAYGYSNGLVRYTMTELCKMARVSVPASEREYILHRILVRGFIQCPKRNDTKCLIVGFIDNDGEDEVCLSEIDCQELAYIYLKLIGDTKFKRCISCGRLMKSKSSSNICSCCDELKKDDKKIWCIDCGQVVSLKDKDTRTCRCKDCSEIYQKKRDRNKHKIKYNRDKILTVPENLTVQNYSKKQMIT